MIIMIVVVVVNSCCSHLSAYIAKPTFPDYNPNPTPTPNPNLHSIFRAFMMQGGKDGATTLLHQKRGKALEIIGTLY